MMFLYFDIIILFEIKVMFLIFKKNTVAFRSILILLLNLYYRSVLIVLNETLSEQVCQWIAEGRWFSLCILVSFISRTDRHGTDLTENMLKVVLATKI